MPDGVWQPRHLASLEDPIQGLPVCQQLGRTQRLRELEGRPMGGSIPYRVAVRGS